MGAPSVPPNSAYTQMYPQPKSVGEQLFPSAYNANIPITSGKKGPIVAIPNGQPPVQPMYEDYMQQAMKLLNPNLYGR